MRRVILDERLRVRRSLLREYRKLGYEVAEQPDDEALPPFLRGFSPDLIAKKDGDRVVVEIRSAVGLKGSNDIKELAARVSEQAGWRFELVALDAHRDAAEGGLSDMDLDLLLGRSLELYHGGSRDVALLYLASVVEELIRDAAVAGGIKVGERSSEALIQQLVFHGVIGETTAAALDRVLERRHRIAHRIAAEPEFGSDEISDTIAACRELQDTLGLQVV